MLIALAMLMAVVWAFGFLVLKVSSVAIHVLVLLVVIALVVHFSRRGAPTA
jgi:hypothetical protein